MKQFYSLFIVAFAGKHLHITVTVAFILLVSNFNGLQANIYGPSSSCAGTTAMYSTDVFADSYSWMVSGGTIVNNYGSSINVRWNGTVSGYVTLQTSTYACDFCVPMDPDGGTQTIEEPAGDMGENGYYEYYVNLAGGAAGITAVSPATICKGGSTQVSLSGQSGTILRWEKLEGGVWSTITQTTPAITVTGINQNMSFRAYVRTSCGDKYSSTVSVSVQAPSVGGYASGPYQVVEGQNEGTISLSGQTGQVVNWEASADGVSWYNYGMQGKTSFSFFNLPSTTYFRAVVKNGTCSPAFSGSVQVNVVPFINGPATVCAGQVYGYGCNANYNTFQWTLTGGVFVDYQGSPVYPATTANTAFVRVKWNTNASTRTITLNASNSETSGTGTIQQPGQTTLDGPRSGSLTITATIPVSGQLTTTATNVCRGGSASFSLGGQFTQVKAWQSSADGTSWQNIPGQTAATWNLTNIQSNVWVRAVLDGGSCGDVYTNTIAVRKWDPVVTGAGSGGASVAYGSNLGSVKLTNYQGALLYWEKSQDGGSTWMQLPNSGSATQGYENLTATTLYRAFLSGGPCGGDAYSPVVTVLVERLLNWAHTKSFDANGSIAGEGRTFTDAMGREVQSQVKNMSQAKVLATQPLYNRDGQPMGQTLPAPIGETFGYKQDFVTKGTAPYHFTHFDGTKTDAPDQVDQVAVNTLGWYYSTSNTLEPYTAVTGYPFAMTTVDNIGGLSRNTLPGNEHRMGLNRETMGKALPVTTELNHYLSLRKYFVTETQTPATLYLKAVKQVSVDQNGQEAIAFVDDEGKTLATALVGSGFASTVVSASLAADATAGLPYLDVHLPANASTGNVTLVLSGTGTIRIYNLKTGAVAYEGTPANKVLSKGFYRVKSLSGSQSLSHEAKYGEFSYNYYDDAGRLVATVAPKGVVPGSTVAPGFVTTYRYNSAGQLLSTTSPDEGTTRYVYRLDGQIRFSQNTRQLSEKKFSYTHYDRAGRLIESGEYAMAADPLQGIVFEDHLTVLPKNNSVLQAAVLESTSPGGGLDPGRCSQQVYNFYDEPDTGSDGVEALTGRKQNFTVGALVKSKNANSTTWCSYDEQGRITWTVQQVAGLGLKTMDYSYNEKGALAKVTFQRGAAEEFIHEYAYDADGRLLNVHTSAQGVRTLQARYSYYLHGPLKRTELGGNLQGVDYTYTVQGWLKSINHVNKDQDPGKDGISNAFGRDLFGMTLQYSTSDYSSRSLGNWVLSSTGAANLYNGMIIGNAWHSAQQPGPQAYAYTYDGKYQLKKAQFGSLASTGSSYAFTAVTKNREEVPGYDTHGNIDRMIRTDGIGAISADYKYNYMAGTNKLASITRPASSTDILMSYAYDELGQMTRETEKSVNSAGATVEAHKYLEYDVTGKVTAVFRDAAKTDPLARFFYDEKGHRIRKETYGKDASNAPKTVTSWYVTDASGNLQGLYTNAAGIGAQVEEMPVYGTGRIGMVKNRKDASGKEYLYELSDHLGNVRAVFRNAEQQVMSATMETAMAQEEEQNFEYVSETRIVDESTSRTGKGAALLHASAGRKYGPSRTLQVQPGDSVGISAWFRYKQEREKRGVSIVPYVAPGKELKAAGEERKGLARAIGKLQLGFALIPRGKTQRRSEGMPRAFVKYAFFDKDSVYISGGSRLLSRGAENNWEEVTLGATAPENASYAVMAVEQEGGDAVYVDDVTVTQGTVQLVQEKHLYPFGQELISMGYTDGTHYNYRYGYQGQYAAKDEEMGWESFELRMYDSRIGRWTSPDPYGQFWSPYVSMRNDPVNQVDPDGGFSLGNIPTYSFPYMVTVTAKRTFFSKIMQTGYSVGSAVINFSRGVGAGAGAGFNDSKSFVRSLGTAEGWRDNFESMQMGAEMLTGTSPQGMMMRAQMGNDIINSVQNIPNMSAYELGYGTGYGVYKGAEVVILSRGIGFVHNVSKVGFGKAAFESSTIGGKSFLFGRGRLGSFNGKANGVLNRKAYRLGWSWDKATQTHMFQPRIGPKFGADHLRPWIKYKP